MNPWRVTDKGDPIGRVLADRHYTRQSGPRRARPYEERPPPPDGLITGVGSAPTASRRSKRSRPGHCFREAGWIDFDHAAGAADVWLRYAGATPVEIPGPSQGSLFGGAA